MRRQDKHPETGGAHPPPLPAASPLRIGREPGPALRTGRERDLYLEHMRQSYRVKYEARRRERRRGVLVLIAIVVALIVASWVWSARADVRAPSPSVEFEWSQPREVYEGKIDRFLAWWFVNVDQRKLARARKLVPILLDATEEHGVNPSLVAAMVTLESSWQPQSVGKLGEVGLLQVMRSDAPLTDPGAQLEHGLIILKKCYTECGTVVGAISKYATGRSCREYRGARLRLRMAAKIEGM